MTRRNRITRQVTRSVAAASAAALLLTACSPVSDEADTVVLRADGSYSPEHLMGRGILGFADATETASNNQIEFEMYFGDSLVTQTEIGRSLPAGVLDLGYLGMAYTPAEFPADNWASNLGYATDGRPVAGFLAATAAMIEFGYTEPALRQELEDAEIHPLLPRFQNHEYYHFLCKEPVEDLDDLRGKRVRVGGQAYAEAVEALGMSPVTLSGSEIYEGFERGVVDCFLGSEIDMMGIGLWELGDQYLQVEMPGWSSISLASSQDFMDSLSGPERQAVQESVPAFLVSYYENYFEDQRRFFTEGAAEHDMQFIDPAPDLEEALDGYYESVRADMIQDAPESIPDPEASIERYEELLEKWNGIVEELGYDTGHETKAEWAQDADASEIDLQPWADKVYEEAIQPNR